MIKLLHLLKGKCLFGITTKPLAQSKKTIKPNCNAMQSIAKILCLLLIPFMANGQVVTTYAGCGILTGVLLRGDGGLANSDTAQLGRPAGLNLDNEGNLLICHISQLVRKVDKTTHILSRVAGSDTSSSRGHGGDGGPATCALITSPYDACTDRAGNLYIADAWYSEVRKVTASTGIIDTFAGNRNPGSRGDGGPAKRAELMAVAGVRFDTGQQYLYISDMYNHKIRRVNMSTNIITTYAGTGVTGYSGDGGRADTAKFSRLLGMCFDKNNNLYVGDWDNARVRKIDGATRIVSTFAGNGVTGYSGDGGPATAARISKPTGMCFDKCGNFFFSNEDSNVVRRIDANTGIITTIAGNGTAGFSGDNGPATAAQFNHPTGVIVDDSGNVFVGDFYNLRVRKVTISNPYIHITASATFVSSGSSVTVSTIVSGGGDTPAFQWYVNGHAISGATGSSYTYTPANGDSVWCVLTSNSRCVGAPNATSNGLRITTAPAGVNEVIASQIHLYPNPAKTQLNISSPVPLNSVIISDLLGRQVFSQQYQSTKAEADITHLAPGMYVVRVNGVYLYRIVKE